jgi:hypothetical protein
MGEDLMSFEIGDTVTVRHPNPFLHRKKLAPHDQS